MLQLTDISWQEVRQAVADMCERLDTCGATRDYDLYVAVAKEWVKAHKAMDTEEGDKDGIACEAQVAPEEKVRRSK